VIITIINFRVWFELITSWLFDLCCTIDMKLIEEEDIPDDLLSIR
jgi:hypothetical protein